MEPLAKKRERPEKKIQNQIEAMLRQKEWIVKSTHGNLYQSGFPDTWCSHIKYGQRWIEIKYLEAYSFTDAQMLWFPLMVANGAGIWILTAATETEYQKLFKPCNWWQFLGVCGSGRRA